MALTAGDAQAGIKRVAFALGDGAMGATCLHEARVRQIPAIIWTASANHSRRSATGRVQTATFQ